MKTALWFMVHLTGLIMMIIVWGTEDVPVIGVPGVFGVLAGGLYGLGTYRMIMGAR